MLRVSCDEVTMSCLLFLDIDGVLNGHTKHPGSPYNGIDPACMARLNRVLVATDADVVLSTAWRYQIICGAVTVRGFEFMLHSHGLIPRSNGGSWIVGYTPSDEAIPGRGAQVLAWLYSNLPREPVSWAVVDDVPDGMSLDLKQDQYRLVITDGRKGLTDCEVDILIDLLMTSTPEVVPDPSSKIQHSDDMETWEEAPSGTVVDGIYTLPVLKRYIRRMVP